MGRLTDSQLSRRLRLTIASVLFTLLVSTLMCRYSENYTLLILTTPLQIGLNENLSIMQQLTSPRHVWSS